MSMIQQYLGRGVHKSWAPCRLTSKFFMVAPNVCGPQYGTFFVLLFWCLQFRGNSLVFFWKYASQP